MDHIPKQRPGLRVSHVNLFDLVLDYLKSRNLLEQAFKMQQEKGDEQLLKSLASHLGRREDRPRLRRGGPPGGQRPCARFRRRQRVAGAAVPQPAEQPALEMGKTPLVMFYPGQYDGKHASAVRQGPEQPTYYRAFRLIP